MPNKSLQFARRYATLSLLTGTRSGAGWAWKGGPELPPRRLHPRQSAARFHRRGRRAYTLTNAEFENSLHVNPAPLRPVIR